MTAPNSHLALLLRIDQRLARVLAGSGSSVQTAPKIVGAFCDALGWACGTLWSRDAEVADRLGCLGAWGIDTPGIAEYLGYTHGRRPILNNAGIVGAAWLGDAPVWVPDIARDEGFRKVPTAMRAGLRTALAFPVAVGDQVLGVVEICSTEVHGPDDALLAGVPLLGGQVAQFLLRAQAQAQLAESEKRLRNLTALSSDWFWEQDAQLRFIRFEGRGVTRTAAEMAPALIGRRLWEVKGLVPGSSDWDAHRAALERREPFRDFETVYRDGKGEMVHISANGDPIHDANGQFTGYRGTARDITVHKQAAQRIQYLSTHDELTGLPNRAALRQLVNQAAELAKRYERRFAVLLLNIDRFQRMNDSLGRDAGDALLRELARRLQQAAARQRCRGPPRRRRVRGAGARVADAPGRRADRAQAARGRERAGGHSRPGVPADRLRGHRHLPTRCAGRALADEACPPGAARGQARRHECLRCYDAIAKARGDRAPA